MNADFQHIFVETNQIRLHVVTAGDPSGKPVILLHGFPEFWYGWRHQIPALAHAGFRVIVPDQRGYNLSDKPKGVHRYRMDELVGDVTGLIEYFGYEKVCLAGHDWGAGVAWSAAISSHAQIEKLAILNVPHPQVLLETLRKSPRQMLRSWYIAFFQIPGLADWLMSINHFAGATRLLRASGRRSTFTEEDLFEYRKAWTNSGGLTGMINWYRAVVRYRSVPTNSRRVQVPTLIMWGKKDIALIEDMARKSVEFCEEGRLIFFDEASHWVQHDESAAVNKELIGFFK